MWRRVASQSPLVEGGSSRGYVKAYAALAQFLREGRMLSGDEKHCVFWNTGAAGGEAGQRFATASALSGMNYNDDGRAVGLVDWDFDGDVDLWLSNRFGPRLRLMRNDTPSDFAHLSILLEGKTCNRDAIGARVEVHLTGDAPAPKLIRTLYAGDGYLTQSSKWLNFGLGKATGVEKVIVRWPGGEAETFSGAALNGRYKLVQHTGKAAVWTAPARKVELAVGEKPPVGHTVGNAARIVITGRLPMPPIDFSKHVIEPIPQGITPKPVLINLWATWCVPCQHELKAWTAEQQKLMQTGIHVVALNVDELAEDASSSLPKSRQFLSSIQWPFAAGGIDPAQAGALDVFHRAYLSLRRPLPVPSSFLVTADGKVAVIYRGPVSVDQVVADTKLLNLDREALRNAAVYLPGRWNRPPFEPNPTQQVLAWMREGYVDTATDYLGKFLVTQHRQLRGEVTGALEPIDRRRLANLCEHLADCYRLKQDRRGVLAAYEMSLQFNPNFVQGRLMLGNGLIQLGQIDAGAQHLAEAHRLAPDSFETINDLGVARAMQGRFDEASALLQRARELKPKAPSVMVNLGRVHELQGGYAQAAALYEMALSVQPDMRDALRQLAWLRATAADDSARNGAQALQYAEQLMKQTPTPDAATLDMLAAAQAEAGRFNEAAQTAAKAVELANAANQAPLAQLIGQRLEGYKASKPHREPPR